MSSKSFYLLRVSYDGSSFYGSQFQPNYRSIEGELRAGFEKYFKLNVPLILSSRTDRGVHALDHPMMIKLPFEIDEEKTKRNLNWVLDKDIQIVEIRKVSSDFHPRYHSKQKTYRFTLAKEISVYNSRYITYYRNEIDIKKLEEVKSLFIGKHNFKNFTSRNKREDYVREVTNIEFEQVNGITNIYVSGTGFLRFMVRNIIASLLEYNEDVITKEYLKQVIDFEVEYNFKKAEPNGLCLYKVEF